MIFDMFSGFGFNINIQQQHSLLMVEETDLGMLPQVQTGLGMFRWAVRLSRQQLGAGLGGSTLVLG